ncbi:NUDIX domain-containing protein [Rhizobium sp. SGZ-381]|uniref:NUDIX hydrolase n=1 Tax=Rhizobium sp. SGZ-381 TaxID=3342800 RepID=UPI00366B1887
MSKPDGPETTASGPKPRPGLRPRPSASLILIDRAASTPRILVGRRGSGHAFMPDVYVFPGGRRDPRDFILPFFRDLAPAVLQKLQAGPSAPQSTAGARALALAAARELHEETGLTLGHPDTVAERGVDLSSLRYLARAVTPPGAVRRFDNRFFATFIDEAEIDLSRLRESDELSDFRWLDLCDLRAVKLPEIVLAVADDLKKSLESGRCLPFGSDVQVYTSRNGAFLRSRL